MQSIPINTYTSPTVILELIYKLKVKHVMCDQVYTAATDTSLREVKELMRERSITGVPILEGKRIVGIISMDDIIQALDRGSMDEPAVRYMSRNLIVLEDDMPISIAISYFDRFRYRRFPVLNKHKELVGMVTSRDITTGLLVEINKEIDRLEQLTLDAGKGDGDFHGTRRYLIRSNDFEKAGRASMEIKKILKARNLDPKTIRRAAIAAYELEINLVIHSLGGEIACLFEDDQVVITSTDRGPGIQDVDLAMEEGYTTANAWIRSLGFGAGMGLPNVKQVSDQFTISSSTGAPTVVQSIIRFMTDQEGA